jgi:hypothetical protein
MSAISVVVFFIVLLQKNRNKHLVVFRIYCNFTEKSE